MDTLKNILSSGIRAQIFRLLFGIGADELHLRELQRRSGKNVSAIRRELNKLVELDLVIARRDGNRLYFSAHRTHPLFTDIRNIVLKTIGLVDVLRQHLKDAQITIAFVFGSVAREATKAGSDIDLMVVGSISSRELSDRLFNVGDQVGREINSIVRTPEEFIERINKKDPFYSEVLAKQKLFIIGNQDELEAMVG